MSQTKSAQLLSQLVKYKVLLALIAFGLWFSLAMLASAEAAEAELIGEIKKQQLIEQYEEFGTNYYDYVLTESEAKALQQLSTDLTIMVYFGTWCHDSVREVPRLLKSFKNQQNPIQLIALDQKKSDPLGLAKAAKVKYTPTFVVLVNDLEIGRIIERPELTLAEDILAIYQQHNNKTATP